MRSNIKKRIIIPLLVVAILALLTGATYVIISRITPTLKQQTDSSTITDKKAAEKVLNSAVESDKLQDFDKAKDRYNKILPFYKKSGESSINDKNTASQIETRLNALEKEKQALDKALSDQAAQSPNMRLVPEGQSNVPR